MVPDAEVLYIACEALTALDIGEFTIKVSHLFPIINALLSLTQRLPIATLPAFQLNHRKILDGIFELAGVPADKTRAISSAVDKLDKAPWAEVRKEMTVDKGLDGVIADKIGEYVGLKGERPAPATVISNNHRVASEGLIYAPQLWYPWQNRKRVGSPREAQIGRQVDGGQVGQGRFGGYGAPLRIPGCHGRTRQGEPNVVPAAYGSVLM